MFLNNFFSKTCLHVFLCFSICLTACVNSVMDEEEGKAHLQEGSIPISFSGKVSKTTSTRVSDKALELGDRIGLMAMLSGTPVSGQRYLDNLLLTASAEGSLVPERTVYYPEGDDAKLDFLAYYPYCSDGVPDGNSQMTVTVQEDQRSDENWDQSDFLVATKTKVSASTNSVTLTFKHKLAKLKVELVPEKVEDMDALLDADPILKASGFYTEATYDFATEMFSDLSKEGVIQAAGAWKKSSGKLVGKELIVVPQEIKQNKQCLILELNGRIYTCQLTDAVLNSNSQRVITIRVKESADNILPGFIGEIDEWGEGTVQEEESETDYKLMAVQTSFLSFNESNIYQLFYAGEPLAEICKEYLRLPDQEVDAQAIVLYPCKNGKADLMQGTVLELLGVSEHVHGGQIEWNTETNSVKYTAGTSAPIRTFYLNGEGEIAFEKPDDALMVHVKNYLLQDIRGTEVRYYGVVKIGTQYWMQEELGTTYYTNGQALVQRTSITDGDGYFITENQDILYNGGVLQHGEMAPAGWRIPKIADWEALVEYVGGVAALKAGKWESMDSVTPVAPATNLSFFNGHPIGLWASKFAGGNSTTAYWSLNETGTDVVDKSLFLIGNIDEYALQNTYYEKLQAYKACSIRCLRK